MDPARQPARRTLAALVPALTLAVAIGVTPALGVDPSPAPAATFAWESVDVVLPGAEEMRVFAAIPAEPTTAATSSEAGPDEQGGFLAGGLVHDPAADDMTRAVAWVSRDGLTWEPVALDAPPASYATSLVSLGDRPLLLGTAYRVPDLRSGGYTPSALAWTREPGVGWRAVETVPDDALPWAADTVPEGIAVVGRSVRKRGAPATSLRSAMQRPAVWASSDGSSWMRTLLPTRPKRLAATAIPARIAVAPDGTRLIGGTDSASGAELLWRSTDGTAWTQVDSPDPADGSYFGGLIGTPSGFALLLVASDGSGATIWTALDGLEWERAYQAKLPLQLVASDGIALAVGPDRVVTSIDGVGWQESVDDAFAGATVLGAGMAPDGSIVVGGHTSEAPLHVWIGRQPVD